MKKIVITTFLVFIFAGIFSQNIQRIEGPTTVLKGNPAYYILYFDKETTEDISITLSCTHGKFDNNNFAVTKVIRKNNLFYQFLVTWDNYDFSNAWISAYKTNNYTNKADLNGIKSLNTSGGGGNNNNIDINTVNFGGPEMLLSGKSAMFSFHIPNTYPVEWSYDPNYFEQISNIAGHDYRSISLKAKNVSTAVNTKLLVLSNGKTREKEVMIVPSANIILGSEYICSRETESYSIQNLPSGATVNWSHGYSNNSAPYPELYTNGNNCTITNKYNWSLALSLKAIIKYANGFKHSIFKNVYSISNSNFIPTGTTLNMIGGNTIQTQSMFFNGSALLYFDNLNKRKVWWDNNSVQPASWSFDADRGLLHVNFNPNQSGPYCFKVGFGTASCEKLYTIYLFKSSITRSIGISDVLLNPVSVSVYNIMGYKVYEEKNISNFHIENTNLERGVYILEIIDELGNISKEKVIKTK